MRKDRDSKIKEQDFSKKYRKAKVRNEKICLYLFNYTTTYGEVKS